MPVTALQMLHNISSLFRGGGRFGATSSATCTFAAEPTAATMAASIAQQLQQQRMSAARGAPAARRAVKPVRASASPSTTTMETAVELRPQRMAIAGTGVATLQGTSRKVNEDRYDIQVPSDPQPGQPVSFVGVYDGHGGSATAEWLKNKLFNVVKKYWRNGAFIKDVTTEAYLQADKQLLTPTTGFLGMGERGVGGSKCGATAATVMVYNDAATGVSRLVTANIGDARVLLIRDGKPEQLTVDHVPDVESERKRIERFNPNPKMPLVRYVAGTWRVGGLLALSRAFGDAYMKGSLQFEGIPEGSDGYSSGFGVIAEPHIDITDLTAADTWVVVSSDGLYNEETRGGGGGLDNSQVAEVLNAADPNADCDTVARALAQAAAQLGSTDDITLVVMRLSPSA